LRFFHFRALAPASFPFEKEVESFGLLASVISRQCLLHSFSVLEYKLRFAFAFWATHFESCPCFWLRFSIPGFNLTCGTVFRSSANSFGDSQLYRSCGFSTSVIRANRLWRLPVSFWEYWLGSQRVCRWFFSFDLEFPQLLVGVLRFIEPSGFPS